MTYFFDSSAIYAITKSGRTHLLVQGSTCSLAAYELGNVLLVERNLLKTITESEQKYLLSAISRALDFMLINSVRGNEQQIMDVAIKYRISFYDASYVYLAKSLNAVLVTEDGKLASKVKGYVETITADGLG